ncbi:MAG: AMP-binding protein [Alphaproteobacteria bacterium]|nr:AMP-binding protein [Alphaproteobacteria bacterium]
MNLSRPAEASRGAHTHETIRYQQGTIAALFEDSATRHTDRDFLCAPAETAEIYGLEEKEYTYSQAWSRVAELHAAYVRIGCRSGVRVGLALGNRLEFFLHFLAINGAGASVVPLSEALSDEELAYRILHSECALIVSSLKEENRFKAIIDRQGLQLSVALSDTLDTVPGEMMTAYGGNDLRATPLQSEAAILYTSGSTGHPKGCVLTNEYFLAVGEHYATIGGYCAMERGRDRIITPLPVTHMNAMAVSFVGAIQSGACLIQLDRFHPNSWWRTVRESRATIMHYLGVMPAILLKAPVAADEDFGDQIKFGFGAGCDPRHQSAFEDRFGFPLIEAWAMTETGAGAWITASHEPRHVGLRCFGKAPAGLDCRVVDDAGRDVAIGEPGELLVRRAGPDPRRYFFDGYLKDDESTKEAWRGDWFHTGDIVSKDTDGSFFFVDRRKNIIRRSGENIAAMEVEGVLMQHPKVMQCVVAPVPDEIRGEEVAALIAQASDSNETLAAEIFEFCCSKLVYFKAPAYIAFVDNIPLTATGKIERSAAKRIARELVATKAFYDLTAFKRTKSRQRRR